MAIEALDIEIKHSSDGAIASIDKLISRMSSLGGVVSSAASHVRDYAQSWKNAAREVGRGATPKMDLDALIESRTELEMLKQQALDLREAIEDALTSGSKKGMQMPQGKIDSLIRQYNNVQAKIAEIENGTENAGGAA